MSTAVWNTSVYGVTDNDINNISTDAMWKTFIRMREEENRDKFRKELDIFCKEIGVATCSIDDDDKEDFVTSYYTEISDYVIPNAKAAVLGDLVARNLQIPFQHITIDQNEEGSVILGIAPYHPWDMPENLKKASEDDYRHAFICAYETLGMDGNTCCIECQSMENWG